MREYEGADPQRDAQLGAALRALRDASAAADIERLRGRVASAAELELARRRRDATWWTHAARWARAGVPAAIAASVLLAIGIARQGSGEPRAARLTLDDPLARVVESDELARVVYAGDEDALLRISLDLEE